MLDDQLFAITASDAMALSMVALLSFALGMIVTILVVMARTGSTRPDVDSSLFEDEEEETSHNVEAGDPPADTAEPWEQDPDWWRKE